MHLGSSPPARFMKKVLGALSRLLRPKTKLFALEFRRILEVLYLQVLQKGLGAHIHDFCVQKWSCKLWSSDAFWKSSLCEVYKSFLTHYHDFCVQKRSCLLWNSDAFWKFSASKVYGASSVRIFRICAPQNEGVSFEVHTHFGSSLPARFTEKVLGALSWFMCPKTKPFAAKFRRSLEVLRLQGLWEKVLGAWSRFVCLTNKHSWLKHFVNNFAHVLQFHAPMNICCVVRTHCDLLDFHIL